MALGIRGVDYVSLPVEDLGKAVAFYRDVLEVRLVDEIRDRWAEFEVGPLRLALYPRETDEGRGGDLALSWWGWTGRRTCWSVAGSPFRMASRRSTFPVAEAVSPGSGTPAGTGWSSWSGPGRLCPDKNRCKP